MKPKEFKEKYAPYALETERKTGINHIAILAQAAVESAWGSVAPGNMFFGVKDTDGINGNEQLLTTTEYHADAKRKYPQLLGITAVVLNGKRLFKYKVKDWFRKYKTPEECFTAHADFFFKFWILYVETQTCSSRAFLLSFKGWPLKRSSEIFFIISSDLLSSGLKFIDTVLNIYFSIIS